jgi:uncharacterized membrane protein
MTEMKALVLDGVVGCLLTWGIVFLLNAVGAANRFQGVAAMVGLVITAFLVGVISVHYERKEEDQDKK